jgi:ectoine hydroxylase-related dioxygenase (phytanoyl-CoA dioxygenase family)
MTYILRDPLLQAQFDRDGYLTFPVLGEDAVLAIRALFEEVRPQVKLEGFATTTTSPDITLKQDMFARIQPWYQPKVEALFQDYKTLGASFLVKDPGQSGALPLHQDWTVTDEDHFRTLTIWIPLEDVTAENGALQMLPGSHQWTNLLRGPNLPIAITAMAKELEQDLVTLPMKAGEGVLFDHRILHKSTLNGSDHPRVAITYGLTHKDTPLCFWYHHPADAADRFEQIAVPDDFFLQYHEIGQRPKMGRSLGFYLQDLSPINSADVAAMKAGQSLARPICLDLNAKQNVAGKPMFPITQNRDWNAELAENGYLIFPLLPTEAVAELKQFFETHQREKVERFYASVHHPDAEFRLRMDAEIQRVLRPYLSELLDEGEALGGSFIAKPKGNAGILPPHADWNIVDERQFRSYNLWIPLVDTTVENGAVHIIPGSHAWCDDIRGPGIPNPFEPHKIMIWEAMRPLEMKAGDALLYDHRLLHASPMNQTETLRLACVMGIKPKTAPMRYYHGQDGWIKEYTANPQFFLTQNPELGPGDLPFLGKVTDQLLAVTSADLNRWLHISPIVPESIVAAQPKRTFWQTYTPGNILREIKSRIVGK